MLPLVLLLAVTPTLKDRELVLVGDQEPDEVVVDRDGVHFDGQTIPLSNFDELTIDLRGGNDSVELHRSPRPCVVDLGDGDDYMALFDAGMNTLTVRCGAGDDVFAADSASLGRTLIDAGKGDDLVLLDFALASTSLAVRMGSGNDTLMANGCTFAGPTTFSGGGGVDEYRADSLVGAPPKVVGF